MQRLLQCRVYLDWSCRAPQLSRHDRLAVSRRRCAHLASVHRLFVFLQNSETIRRVTPAEVIRPRPTVSRLCNLDSSTTVPCFLLHGYHPTQSLPLKCADPWVGVFPTRHVKRGTARFFPFGVFKPVSRIAEYFL